MTIWFTIRYVILHHMGFPIRISADHSLFAAPRSFSQLVTSFFGSWCQGIPLMLFLAWTPLYISRYTVLWIAVFHVFYSYFLLRLKLLLPFSEKPDFYIFFFPCFLKSLFVFAFSYSVFNDLPPFAVSRVIRLQKHLTLFKYFWSLITLFYSSPWWVLGNLKLGQCSLLHCRHTSS